MKILTLNCGSSSIKYKVFEDDKLLVGGLIEKIGEKPSKIKNHAAGLKLMVEQILESGVVHSMKKIDAVGHRVVHGGGLSKPSIINKKVLGIIKHFSSLAPLHNPVNLKGITEMKKMLPRVPHVAVFDTAFHQTMPEYVRAYAIPHKFLKQGIKRYGFHGISHKYVAYRASKLLGKPIEKLKLITCHLGAGCSVAAVKNGRVYDTSMGFTPLEGLMMGTRSGDVDPGVIFHLISKFKMSPNKVKEMLNEESGLDGVSGLGKDFRKLRKAANEGNKQARLAIGMFCYRIKKYIGQYIAAMEGVDAIIFTGGIGDNNYVVRDLACDMPGLGIKVDSHLNEHVLGKEGIINAADSKVDIMIIPTDEGKMIAREVLEILK